MLLSVVFPDASQQVLDCLSLINAPAMPEEVYAETIDHLANGSSRRENVLGGPDNSLYPRKSNLEGS